MQDIHADLILDPGIDAGVLPVEDFRHRSLRRGGYEMRLERTDDAPVRIWWRREERIGRTTAAMQHYGELLDRIEHAKTLLADEGYRVVSANGGSDPRRASRLWLVSAAVSLAVALYLYVVRP